MLHRAASNAYSWWWSSHVRTKQSKWLEQNLQDMEEKVNMALKIIDDGGDSFAERAEMYYRKRPEIIGFVEESYRSYRALAERYDHLSRELQSANRTIATAFPERAQYSMDIDDDDNNNHDRNHHENPDSNQDSSRNQTIPKVPKIPAKEIRPASKKSSSSSPRRIAASSANNKPVTSCSGLTKAEALEEIDTLQKSILGLQTEKEFVKCMYEHGYSKFREIENRIAETHKRVGDLQDEFSIGSTVIEDDEARTLMAATALRSCHDTLEKLNEKRERSAEEARAEQRRIQEAHERFESLRAKFEPHEPRSMERDEATEESDNVETVKNVDLGSEASCLSVTELAEKIDELVGKVVTLETEVSSQTALVKRLGSETDRLQSHVQCLEEDKESLKEGSAGVSKRLKKLEEELLRVKGLNKSFKAQNENLQTHFTEASCSLDHLSVKLQSVKHEDKEEEDDLVVTEASGKETVGDYESSRDVVQEEEEEEEEEKNDTALEISIDSEKKENQNQSDSESTEKEEHGKMSLRRLFLRGLEDREKLLLEEYTSVLQDYKEVKKKLSESENKNRDSIFELAMQVRELKSDIATRDDEINSLKHRFSDFQQTTMTPGGDSPFTCSTETNYKYSNQETPIEENKNHNHNHNHNHNQNQQASSSSSSLEEKFRSDIDGLLEENLEFWLRFSTLVHQIQKFEASVEDLHLELRKLREHKKRPESIGSSSLKQHSIQSDARPIYRHLREIQTEMSLWFEHNAVIKDELQGRFSSLCHIQNEISRVSGSGSKMELSVYQAAKFQGEILNMKQENNKVAEELFVGLNRVRLLKLEVEKTLVRLNEELGISASSKSDQYSAMKQPPTQHRPRIPLRSFLFGVKLKKQKQSIFSARHKHHGDFATNGPLT